MALTQDERCEAWALQTARDFLEQSCASPVVNRRVLGMTDEDVKGLYWVSEYFHVWLLKGPGVEYFRHPAVTDPYIFYIHVIAKAIWLNVSREYINRASITWYDREVYGESATPILVSEELEEILQADQTQRNQMYGDYIRAVRTQRADYL